MPKFPKPFFRSGRGWYVQVGKQQIKLADGPENKDTEAAAFKRYHVVMSDVGRDKSATAKPDGLSVAEVFDKYLDWCEKHREPRTFEWYRDHIQSFMDSLKVQRMPAWTRSRSGLWCIAKRPATSPAKRSSCSLTTNNPKTRVL